MVLIVIPLDATGSPGLSYLTRSLLWYVLYNHAGAALMWLAAPNKGDRQALVFAQRNPCHTGLVHLVEARDWGLYIVIARQGSPWAERVRCALTRSSRS